ncbi:hypothetical protein NPIL_661921 [Nephila pilipes]|uniref:Uncharacterized protein n=1 Tax=Nephila pilipes TaxID=299642 RepID=A0A8X6QV93_NEPPI|nr:hypothetical protein NPIL_661921 [Nephila pilipes]
MKEIIIKKPKEAIFGDFNNDAANIILRSVTIEAGRTNILKKPGLPDGPSFEECAHLRAWLRARAFKYIPSDPRWRRVTPSALLEQILFIFREPRYEKPVSQVSPVFSCLHTHKKKILLSMAHVLLPCDLPSWPDVLRHMSQLSVCNDTLQMTRLMASLYDLCRALLGMDATADCDLGEENLLPWNSVEMDVSNATIPQESSLDNNNQRRCQKIQYHIEKYTLSVQKRIEVEAIIKNAQLILIRAAGS